MVTQTLISFKCDSLELSMFDKTCESLGVKRNTLLNFLVHYANSNAGFYADFCKIVAYQRALSLLDSDDE